MTRSEEIVATEVQLDDVHVLPADEDVTPAERGVARSGNPLSLLPLLLGVLILALDVYLLSRLSPSYFQKTFQGAITLALLAASVIICIALIAYALAIGRFEKLGQRIASPFATWVGIPLLLALVALAATIGGMELNRATAERQLPAACIDLYQKAEAIAKDNPRFRMSPTDRDEVRCGINAAIGR